jgi:hypothetical protein
MICKPEFVDSAGFTILGDDVEVRVAVSVRLSKQYQSAGVEAGVTFKTPVAEYEKAMKAAQGKVRKALADEARILSRALDTPDGLGCLDDA